MNGKTVLVIDDSETVRATVSDRLERGGYNVASAQNGREGLRRLYEIKPDVVLLDVVMPELDGWKTLELIRDVSDVPVIMLTSRDTELERVRGLRSGADDYMGKPSAPRSSRRGSKRCCAGRARRWTPKRSTTTGRW